MSEKGVIYEEKPQKCDLCGKIAELRPYGPKGECVCFGCGMKDERSAQKACAEHLGFEELEQEDE